MASSVQNKLYYFAHPYSGKYNSPIEHLTNFKRCCFRANRLIRKGWNIFAPVCHSHAVDEFGTLSWARWMELDRMFLKRCRFTGVILAPDWEESQGCREEKEHFNIRGKQVLFYKDIIPPEEDRV